jgi:hypothetical protein
LIARGDLQKRRHLAVRDRHVMLGRVGLHLCEQRIVLNGQFVEILGLIPLNDGVNSCGVLSLFTRK